MKFILPDLPAKPVIKIRPRQPWAVGAEISELWEHRELLYFFIWRDLKVRYKQTALGSFWIILQPLSMTIVFACFLGMLGHTPSNNIPYTAFAYAGLMSWIFFTNSVLSSSYSLAANSHLISKIYFPRIFIPIATVAVRLVDFIVAMVILAIMIVYYGLKPNWGILLFPVLVIEITLLALSIGMFSASLNVKFRDVGTVLPVLMQLFMFISPVIYPISIVPDRWQAVYMLNPLAGILENQRAVLFGLDIHWTSFFTSLITVLFLLFLAALFFQKVEENLADII